MLWLVGECVVVSTGPVRGTLQIRISRSSSQITWACRDSTRSGGNR